MPVERSFMPVNPHLGQLPAPQSQKDVPHEPEHLDNFFSSLLRSSRSLWFQSTYVQSVRNPAIPFCVTVGVCQPERHDWGLCRQLRLDGVV